MTVAEQQRFTNESTSGLRSADACYEQNDRVKLHSIMLKALKCNNLKCNKPTLFEIDALTKHPNHEKDF